ncbi:Uncharacterised protein [Legionella pneumophila]|nr:hypothetical protein LPE509_00648 [Legionella pneumophila subsp. pneumophila LPE509]CZG49348.1 Uncharacterised protein [Legionella pneumophila]CZG65289.1 Uncharacterised protein [Legionella pneumophila]CZG67021.1 Uncharacterised protein [Legionella pneumophila]CZG74231.1 Uncharacterised protein [Legionella pneumophila]
MKRKRHLLSYQEFSINTLSVTTSILLVAQDFYKVLNKIN